MATHLRVHHPNGPKCFSGGYCIPKPTHNARTCAFTHRGQGTKPQMQSIKSARVFILSPMRKMGKKSQQSPKGSNLWPPVSACTTPMDPNASPVPNASHNVHIMPGHEHSLTVGRARKVKCNQSRVQGFSFYRLCAVWATKANNLAKVSTCGQRFSPCTAPMDPHASPAAAAPPNVHIMPAHVHSMPMCRTPNLRSRQLAVRGFHSISYTQYGQKEANDPKGSNLCLRVLRVPGANVPNSSSGGCFVP